MYLMYTYGETGEVVKQPCHGERDAVAYVIRQCSYNSHHDAPVISCSVEQVEVLPGVNRHLQVRQWRPQGHWRASIGRIPRKLCHYQHLRTATGALTERTVRKRTSAKNMEDASPLHSVVLVEQDNSGEHMVTWSFPVSSHDQEVVLQNRTAYDETEVRRIKDPLLAPPRRVPPVIPACQLQHPKVTLAAILFAV